ncbi:MAG: membrane protein insertase YidC [Candidatus Omnitrophica bacterium]|nr:membrane protein insertase YidC [Candidatus Omnitrophota bacterium]MBU4488049.1 membrane protein insertase YidC [Candidatus Omnitrophota bacterium]MCG2704840.1 membrane protein insertase YidC [Candidatus Omnitrophota bacterium]
MDKKTILAVILSVLVVIGYQVYTAKFYPAVVETGTTQAPINKMYPLPGEKAGAGAVAISTASEEIAARELPEKIIIKETEKYIVELSSVGGCIKDIKLKNGGYSPSDKGSDLIAIQKPENAIFNMEGLGFGGLSKTGFKVEEKGNEIIFSSKLAGGLELVKKYIFYNSLYNIDLEVYIKNNSSAQVRTSYTINTAADIGVDSSIDKRYIQAVAEIDGKTKRNNGAKGKGLFKEGSIGYAGLQNRYFSVIAKSNIPTDGLLVKRLDDENILSAISVSEFAILPQSVLSHKFVLYAGPTSKKIMSEYGIESAASFGFLGGISNILLAALRLFHKVFRNWGVAVILLSVLVNLVLFPLSRKSYESMKKMQTVQPHMDKLREEHKDNPQKLNKEIMELYKKHQVNPMGGCLPLILQMPVFIALYQTLMKSLELRGARFLWIKDLSMPDAVLLPFNLPLIGDSINILPILMAGAMVFQQKFSTAKGAGQSQQQKQQQQMMVIMPVIFLFIMYNFPSGLVLYWLVNTLLTMFEQRAIMHS